MFKENNIIKKRLTDLQNKLLDERNKNSQRIQEKDELIN